jgi:hypothetical protein
MSPSAIQFPVSSFQFPVNSSDIQGLLQGKGVWKLGNWENVTIAWAGDFWKLETGNWKLVFQLESAIIGLGTPSREPVGTSGTQFPVSRIAGWWLVAAPEA